MVGLRARIVAGFQPMRRPRKKLSHAVSFPGRYVEAVNQTIEQGFQQGVSSVPVTTVGRSFAVHFNPGSSFALQRDDTRNKERQVRRVVKTVQVFAVLYDPPYTLCARACAHSAHVLKKKKSPCI